METLFLPKTIGDGRLDTVLMLFARLKEKKGKKLILGLNWSRTQFITPAGFAILACLFDKAVEQRVWFTNISLKKSFADVPVLKNLDRVQDFSLLPSPKIHNFENKDCLLEGTETGFNLSFIERIQNKFGEFLSEELFYSCQLIIHELMVNCVDHSAVERYYTYAGLDGREFCIGVLDTGITIPAKLERKYSAKNEVALLELAFQEGITTRTKRLGGMGLSHTLDQLKNFKGKLSILSRGAQVRRYFNRRSVIKGPLKYPVDGTWCFARFPLGGRR